MENTMDNSQWEFVQDGTGTDIMTIVMNLTSGATNAGETMDKINEHCLACYKVGLAQEMRDHADLMMENTFLKRKVVELESMLENANRKLKK